MNNDCTSNDDAYELLFSRYRIFTFSAMALVAMKILALFALFIERLSVLNETIILTLQ